ncbi:MULTISPECIES: NAD(P)/FAD-dependent oxidoreductase [unclassified Oceanispirochaeta]|uniref:NAD(P)/FAD-dependent oxidoreductase n=1 Tax=unclassified Oceanispirochaeta TaxID=2635722 RepID=UPI000E096C52|nr:MULTISPECIES: FAD-dependent oxidoreductase [unclassified Oceanispirochaeta]MBF9016467.1 FAD-dependent oxidoreductase [Oceanispirochaeta sp. M2]NPD72929.1 FAD-dependent oxidoreductase [Oceanispirochaeta sp. M1]RDG31505.1 FAD-dependent oxidoreductase [Oceanispirochaeta sp. M1]
MGKTELNINISTDYKEEDLDRQIRLKLRINNLQYRIIKKSLDSRRKDRIHWQIRVLAESPEIKESPPSGTTAASALEIPKVPGSPEVVIAGSGPAGIFPALFLQKAGFKVTILERGKNVDDRAADIEKLEKEALFTENSNYSFGEGGAGTFSDGKLTSRSKHIKKERRYILEEFVRHGAPEEILYLAHPHIGSDRLLPVARSMRRELEKLGGKIEFDSSVKDLDIKDGRVRAVITDNGSLEADYFILATGHSALDTFRMLINRGVPYISKNFALGFRMEHSQESINRIQWGCPSLEGVKAAEYRLTSGKADLPVYSFCMCPGGKVVPAATFSNTNIVNGMSYYDRSGAFANAALVAGVPPRLINENEPDAAQSLNWLEALEQKFYRESSGYKAPSMTIKDFLKGESGSKLLPTSYEPGLLPADLGKLLPSPVTNALRLGLEDICHRMPGWEEGQLIGLESKTSSPVQVLRNRDSGLCDGFENLFICGEASGWSGGIISSASDGLKTALSISCSLI